MNEIETKFFNAFESALLSSPFIRKYGDDYYSIVTNEKNHDHLIQFEAQPENEEYFSGYRPDFVIYINGGVHGYVIEIDGHEWHEKTREQARIDKEKDRAYLKNNFIPIRFTGYEVYHNADGCAKEVIEIICDTTSFFSEEIWQISDSLMIDEKRKLEKEKENLIFGFDTIQAFKIENGNIMQRCNVIVTSKSIRR